MRAVRQRWPLLLLLVSGLAFLAGLYLPWQQASAGAGGFDLDGWTDFGYVSALFVLVLAAVSVVSLFEPLVALRAPLGRAGAFVGYAGVAIAVETSDRAREAAAPADAPVHFHVGYGTYVGVSAAAGVAFAALVIRGSEIRTYIASRFGLVVCAAVALLVAFALPWLRIEEARITVTAYAAAGTVVAAALAVWAAGIWLAAGARVALACGAVALLFVLGALSSLGRYGTPAYGAWLGLGASALLVLALASDFRPHVRLPGGVDTALVSVSALAFVATLYLRWQGPSDGWTFLGAVSALLAISIVAALFVPLPLALLELATMFALYASLQGVVVSDFWLLGGYRVQVGAILGFVTAGALVVSVLFRVRGLRPPSDRTAPRLVGALAATVSAALAFVPYWGVLPDRLAFHLRYPLTSWFAAAGVALAIRVAGEWLRRTVDGRIVWLLSVALLVLVALEMIRLRTAHLTVGGWLVVGLSALLALLGWFEQRGGLEKFSVPEILHVDRL